jgi:hypothetical protein
MTDTAGAQNSGGIEISHRSCSAMTRSSFKDVEPMLTITIGGI